MKLPSNKLVHLLIGKSIAETLVVGALAVFTFITVLPPYFHGWGEVTETGISGWAVNNASPWERVNVQLFIDDQFVAARVADQSRPDVYAAGWAKDQWHGYTFDVREVMAGAPANSSHEARVYSVHDSGGGTRKSLQLLGDPILFIVANDGRLVKRNQSGSGPDLVR
ncbi:MAG TPA: hypothetical protein VGO56_14785 [Pyrinomonadaceae bacterium]|jgi:hypothetical protein|nr:hypothetical protein [Pyrinomonadaceae bacterium]